MQFPKKLLQKAALPGKYKSMSLHAFMVWVHLTFLGEKFLNVSASRTNYDPISSSAIPNQDRRAWENGNGRHTPTNTLPVEDMNESDSMKCDRYPRPLDMLV